MTTLTHPRDPAVKRPLVIAVDGPAAAGKGTLARRLAEALGLAYLDTGLLYRAVGMNALEQNVAPGTSSSTSSIAPDAAIAAARALTVADLQRADLRSDAAANAASHVAAIPAVREALLSFQRQFAAAPPEGSAGAVLDGRDIGSVVCPDARVKVFVTASETVRAARRYRELRQRGLAAIHSRVLTDMRERDARDRARVVAPLKPAEDAIVIDTSELDPDIVLGVVLKVMVSSLGALPTARGNLRPRPD
ncbi:MAG: (d)CMP kinase [Rhodospirillales bacterium]|nr:(d)CMP kinase [Rhodospirillales bacterium]